MARGVISGLVWGVVVGVAGLVAANEWVPRVSLVAFEPPEAVEPPQSVEPSEAVEPPQSVEPSIPSVPAAPDAPVESPPALDSVTVPETVIPGAPPQPDTGAQTGTPMAQTAPAAKPEPAPAPGGDMRAPQPETQADMVTPSQEEPIIPGPESVPPSAGPVDEAPQTAQVPVTPVAPTPAPARPAPDAAGAPGAPLMSDPAPATPAPTAPREPGPSDIAEAPQTGGDGEQVAVMNDDDPRILDTREGTLSGQAGNVTVGRLPSIGAGSEPPADDRADPQLGTTGATGQALRDNAQPFDAPPELPIMSIILIDQGGEISDADLNNLPFPISFAIDASRPDAAERAARYRSAGQEVVLIAELPTGAQPTDAAVTMNAAISALGTAVAVMDVPGAKFQSSRATAAQVVASAAQTGHGIITYARGLNAAQQVAAREGVPAAVVFRVFDGEGRSGPAMTRYLDQAAFRAGQTDGLITVGHLKADTLQALADWATGNRAAGVTMAPVSTVLMAQVPQDAPPEQ